MSLITFKDVQGDTSFIKPSAIDGVVTAEHQVPTEVGADGKPASDKTALKFFAVAILRNGRQVLESFDTADERNAKVKEITELL